eukprot:TRINITY_DN2487_c0_g1_i1.p1 TRINITY_DN2487_c0_g1~~TRINITY_DN2487_c0_g1_i1.p1  ORF type:complete len:392 (+),score=132.74 TRINITY_DN2487_c0_g1_i1:163-1338(+)
MKNKDPVKPTNLDDSITLKINLFSAGRLLMRKKGKTPPDPYAQIDYKGVTFETEVLKNTNNPKWNQTFEFKVTDKDALGQIVITIFDYNASPKKKNQIFLGERRIYVNDFSSTNFDYADRQTLVLQDSNEKSVVSKSNTGGEIAITIGMNIPTSKSSAAKKRRTKKEGTNGETPKTTEELIQESEEVIDDSLASVQRSLAMANTAKQTGVDTLDALERQNEQLRRIQGDVDDIHGILDKNEKNLAIIESPFGGLKDKLRRKKKHKDLEKADKTVEVNMKEADNERKREHKKVMKEEKSRQQKEARYGKNEEWKPSLDHLSEEAQDKDKQVDEGLDALSNLVGDMKNIGIAMGYEIEASTERVGQVQQSIKSADERGKKQTERVKKAMGKKY